MKLHRNAKLSVKGRELLVERVLRAVRHPSREPYRPTVADRGERGPGQRFESGVR